MTYTIRSIYTLMISHHVDLQIIGQKADCVRLWLHIVIVWHKIGSIRSTSLSTEILLCLIRADVDKLSFDTENVLIETDVYSDFNIEIDIVQYPNHWPIHFSVSLDYMITHATTESVKKFESSVDVLMQTIYQIDLQFVMSVIQE
jgi:GH15 family glucan-1,4-alpha-glucosidase